MKTMKLRTLFILLFIMMHVMTAATIAYGRAPSIATTSFTTQHIAGDCLKIAHGTLKTEGYTESPGSGSISVWANQGDYKALIEAREISDDQRLVIIIVAGPGGQADACTDQAKQLRNTMQNDLSGQQRQSREELSEQNQKACEAWCKSNSECVKCDTKPGCGLEYKALQSWTGRGTNWYACGKLSNQESCEAWCKSNSECIKCDTAIGCGVGYTRLKSWTGAGQNWHACGKR